MSYIGTTWACILGLVIVCQDYQTARLVGEFNLELHRIQVSADVQAYKWDAIRSLGEPGDNKLERLRRK